MIDKMTATRSRPVVYLVLSLAAVILLRLVIYQWLCSQGYFYGIPWDSFSRTLISYTWSHQPFFSLSDGYWLPLQFWLVGSVYAIIQPWLPTSDILVPVVVNNLFFVGSLAVVYRFTLEATQKIIVAFTACLMAGLFAGDIFATYTALSEPMLIFFILFASYLFYRMVIGNQQDHSLGSINVSIIIFLAAATHYIGWFLSLFFCFYLIFPFYRSIIKKNYYQTGHYLFAIFLCVLMPVSWLINSYILFNDPFYPTQMARQAQAAYIGQMALSNRFLVIPKVLIKQFYPIMVLGFFAVLALLYRKNKALIFLIPSGFILSLIWVSTAMAFSAPYQEPRYLVFIGWVVIPMIAIAGNYLIKTKSLWGNLTLGSALIIILVFNIAQIRSFKNSFGPDVQEVSNRAKSWFNCQPENARIILQGDSFAEGMVIQVMSGYPNRIHLIPRDLLATEKSDLVQFFTSQTDVWLFISKKKGHSEHARQQGLSIEQIGNYYIISPP